MTREIDETKNSSICVKGDAFGEGGKTRRRSIIHNTSLMSYIQSNAFIRSNVYKKIPLEAFQNIIFLSEFWIVSIVIFFMGNPIEQTTNFDQASLVSGLVAGTSFALFRLMKGRYHRNFIIANTVQILIDSVLLVLSFSIGFLIYLAFDKQLFLHEMIVFFIISLFGLFFVHMLKGQLFTFLLKKRYAVERVAIYGAESEVLSIGEKIISDKRNEGVVLVSVYDQRENLTSLGDGRLGLALSIDELLNDVVKKKIDHILICLLGEASKRTLQIQKKLENVAVKVSFVQTDFQGRIGSIVLDEIPIYGWEQIFKSTFDIVLSIIGLVVFSPLLLIISIAIKLESQGGILFKQERTGFNNQMFVIYKFRTMYGPGEKGEISVQAVKGDTRVTKVGAFLRRWSLDELPQILNVLKGDMTLIGPRPHAKGSKAGDHEFEKAVQNYCRRHRIKPGISGWAQVNGYRGVTETAENLQKRLEHDIYYMENYSLWFDIKIFFMTIYVIFFGKNAY